MIFRDFTQKALTIRINEVISKVTKWVVVNKRGNQKKQVRYIQTVKWIP